MNIVKKVCNWYFSKGALPYWGILFLDCSAVFFSGLTVYYFRHGGMGLVQDFWQVTNGLLLSLVLYVMAFFVFHTFRGVMRYASFVDLHGVVYSTATAGAAVCLLHQVEIWFGLTPYIIMPRLESAILIFIIATMMMWALRILVRTLHDLYRGADDIQKVFVYGCMQGGIALAKSIRENTTSKYRLGGFVSSDKSLCGNWLLGVQIYYDDDNLVSLMQKKRAKAIFVSPFVVEHFTRRTALIDELINADIKIFMMSDAEEWDGKSDLSHHQLREVEIEDLLPREKIEVDLVAIGSMLRDKRILITGAAGSIGSEMVRQIAKFSPAEFILVDQAETPMHDVRRYMARNYPSLKAWTIVGSITNKDQMEEIFRHHHPEYVFHAAAYKHVPMMEDNPAMAVQNNIYGTRVIADLAVKYGTKKFVMISTDKAVNPTNVMGCSKRICEIYCQSLNKKLEEEAKVTGKPATQFITTRFGNVLGSNGSVIPIFKEQIKKGGPVMVTHPDIIRYFMLIPEACRLVLQAGTMGKGGEIFVFDMGAPVKIVDLAKRMIRLSGAQNIEIKFSGLRDGEKLYEEVLNDKEVTKGTTNPKIMVAAVREYPYDLAVRNEKELYDLSFTFDDMQIVKKMKAIVPEYKSQHSKYQELDE
ncbi:putative epimerase/dehydratase WbiI [Segatella baroniae F0067]|uniref:Putative epimerase/dehydratase WbiI n=1 Tax=Segatella baroniae F0067 TaxID=1115809 RepID=U2P473_9BACT|nr:nucleoside-diphosphate sugar epimerase/dehydratase [Segatella baroniae]ERK38474.1 putative epimerase/dehydratase WbiI [Segatella baroniae F0067]